MPEEATQGLPTLQSELYQRKADKLDKVCCKPQAYPMVDTLEPEDHPWTGRDATEIGDLDDLAKLIVENKGGLVQGAAAVGKSSASSLMPIRTHRLASPAVNKCTSLPGSCPRARRSRI